VRLKVDRFAFTSNNITYTGMDEQFAGASLTRRRRAANC
jgi:hypothetical protein